jgi:hypothetical protein
MDCTNERGRPIGGRCEIRTHEELAPLPVFKTGAFNRSANLPHLNLNGLLGEYFTTRYPCTPQALYLIARSGMRWNAAADRYTRGVGYIRETTSAEPDPIELEVRQRETVDVPMMASAGAITPSVILMLAGRIKQSASG